MNAVELRSLVVTQEVFGLSRTILVVKKRVKPKFKRMKVKGVGYADVIAIDKQDDGTFMVKGWFLVSDLRRILNKVEICCGPLYRE